MKCYDELIYSMYLDGELAEVERLKVAAHLEQCAECRTTLKQMEEENRRITNAFATNEECPDLVNVVMKQLTGAAPGLTNTPGNTTRKSYGFHFSRWGMATAASFLVMAFLFYFLFQGKPDVTPDLPAETRILICNARVEGVEVQSHIMNSQEMDTTFIWFEKK
ncbi:MAG: hypothetical protein GY757_48365 [bacterium]|nr:hypothetical protein [bacterium]